MSARTGERRHIPVRDMEREKASSGSGPVKTWKMSPEELEEYRGRTGYKEPRNWEGEKISPPVQQKSRRPNMSSAEQSRRAKMKQTNEPDKQKFLELIAAGKSIAAAERDLGLKTNGMYYWLKKWELVGINPGKALDLLGGPEEPALLRSTTPAAEAIEERAKGLVNLKGLVNFNAQEEIVRLEKRVEKLQEELKTAQQQSAGYEDELTRWAQVDNEKSLQLSELAEERDNWKAIAENRKEEILELSEFLDAAKQRIRELEFSQIPRIEMAPATDAVNRPSHYTHGGIETIAFIRAKLTPEEFEGYCKGNVLKYVARATHKGGIEDLRKAGKYIEFATGGER